MEHSEEYYKMKYFKYKAKYEQAKVEQNGGTNQPKPGMVDRMKSTFGFGTKVENNKPIVDQDKQDLIKRIQKFYNYNTGNNADWSLLTNFDLLKIIIEEMDIKSVDNDPDGVIKNSLDTQKNIYLAEISKHCNNNGQLNENCLPETSRLRKKQLPP